MLEFKTSSPESVGIPTTAIINFIKELEFKEIPMHSILLLKNDTLITEGYYAPYTKSSLHRMFSITKSFVSIAIGLLEEEGLLSLTDPIISYFPDKLPKEIHPWLEQMTIKDMLMMRTCHASTTYKMDMVSDWVESFFTTPPTHPSGSLFHYDTSSSHTLCALVERLSKKSLLSYLKDKCLNELSFSDEAYILQDPFGVSMGGSGLVALPMDMLKFGYLIAHKGTVNGKELVPSNYIKTATSNLTDTIVTSPCLSESMGYGYQFWQSQHGGHVCYGMGGQFILILPKQEMILVTTADTQGIAGGNQMIYDAFYSHILPAINHSPLPENLDLLSTLHQTISHLKVLPLKIVPVKVVNVPHCGMGNIYYMVPNSSGFLTIQVNFNQNETDGELVYTTKTGTYRIPFGLGHLVTSLFPFYNMHCATSGAWLADGTFYIKSHIMDSSIGSVHFQFSFGTDTVTIFMRKQEESLFQEFSGHFHGKRFT